MREHIKEGTVLRFTRKTGSFYTAGKEYVVEEVRGGIIRLSDDKSGGHEWGHEPLANNFELVTEKGNTVTETQKAVAAKMLTEILEEKIFDTRARRVSEYGEFTRACDVGQDNGLTIRGE